MPSLITMLLIATGTNPLCLPVLEAPHRSTRSPLSVVIVAPARAAAETLEELYAAGQTWDAFYDAATGRRALWEENRARAAVPDALLERARAVPGTWRILVIAVDACSDSVNSIPYIAKLAASVAGLDLRIVHRDRGRALMESHRTPDGRAATPTIILLNEKYEEAGCWIERPSKLQDWYLENHEKLESAQLLEQKMAWYRDDAGRETLREIVEMIEAAAAGRRICASGPAR